MARFYHEIVAEDEARRAERIDRIKRRPRRDRAAGPIRSLLRQARHELGIVRLLGECVVIPAALTVFGFLAAFAGLFDHG